MAKETIKKALGYDGDPSLVDTDRLVQKAEGGTYEDGNVRLLEPRAHMARHGTLRAREESLAIVKSVLDDRVQTMKLLLKINNQLLAYRRRVDDRHPDTELFLEDQRDNVAVRLAEIDRTMTKAINNYAERDPLTATVLGVPFVGPVTATMLATYVIIERAQSASSLWKYVGYHKPSHKRYELEEGQDPKAGRGGNKTLRTALFNTVTCMWRGGARSAYRLIGDRVKARLEVSEKIVTSGNTQGKLVEIPWKDTKPSHRHGAALRAMAKHFLADYWFVGRELAGLSTRPLYVQEQLGHTGIIQPQERGWVW